MPDYSFSKKFKHLLPLLYLLTILLPSVSLAADDEDEIVISPDMKVVTTDRLRGTGNVTDIPIEYTVPMIGFFNGYLKDKHTRYAGCHSMIDVTPQGKTYGHDGYVDAFGAVCYKYGAGVHENVAVCADDMVGNFKEQQIDKATWTKVDLIKFVINNCIGG